MKLEQFKGVCNKEDDQFHKFTAKGQQGKKWWVDSKFERHKSQAETIIHQHLTKFSSVGIQLWK
jgi:hypothetical protein